METNKGGTSKTLLIFSYAVAMILIVLSILFPDNDNIVTITVAWFAECTVYSGFYIWKSKNENRSKYAQQFIKDMAKEYGIDSVARILEIILKD